jgi:hypothetical protein
MAVPQVLDPHNSSRTAPCDRSSTPDTQAVAEDVAMSDEEPLDARQQIERAANTLKRWKENLRAKGGVDAYVLITEIEEIEGALGAVKGTRRHGIDSITNSEFIKCYKGGISECLLESVVRKVSESLCRQEQCLLLEVARDGSVHIRCRVCVLPNSGQRWLTLTDAAIQLDNLVK